MRFHHVIWPHPSSPSCSRYSRDQCLISAAAAATPSPSKQQTDGRLKQLKIEPAQVNVEKWLPESFLFVLKFVLCRWICRTLLWTSPSCIFLQSATFKFHHSQQHNCRSEKLLLQLSIQQTQNSCTAVTERQFRMLRFCKCMCYQRSAGIFIRSSIRSKAPYGPYGGQYGHPQNRMNHPSW